MSPNELVIVKKEELLEDIQQLLDQALEQHNIKRQPGKYVNAEVAKATLGVKTSKLQQLRNNDEIKYSKTSTRGIMYDYQSLIDYLDRKVVE